MSRSLTALVLSASTALALACGGGGSDALNERIAQELAEKAMEAGSPGTDVELRDGALVIKTAEGQFSSGDAATTEGLPAWLQPPSGAKLVSNSRIAGAVVVMYETSTPAKEACAAHDKQLPSGWSRTATTDMGEMTIHVYSGANGANATVSCTQGSPSVVNLTATGI